MYKPGDNGHIEVHNQIAVSMAGLRTDVDGKEPAGLSAETKAQQLATFAGVAAPLAPKRRVKPNLEDSTVILMPRVGHGWTLTQGTNGGTVTEDTTRPGPFSDRSFKLTKITGDNPQASLTGQNFDLAAGPITVFAYVTDLSPKGFYIQVGDSTLANFYSWDRYGGDALDNIDGWTVFELYTADAALIGAPTPTTANKQIRIRLTSDNTTVWIGAIIQRADPSTLYPNGVCTVYFDDGDESQFLSAMPTLAKYGDAATLSTVAELVDTPGFITLAQLHVLQETAGWEIAAHAYSADTHLNRFTSLTASGVDSEFDRLKEWLVSNGFDTSTWISPGGAVTASIWASARRYFTFHRGVANAGILGIRQGRLRSARPMYPARFTSPNFHTTTMTKANMLATLDAIKASRAWGSLTFHQIDPTTSNGQVISVTDLDEIIAYAHTIGVPIRTMNRVLKDAN